MSKELKALKEIKKLYKSYIEKIGLNEKDILGFDLGFAHIEKVLKAFEILKEFGFEIEDYTENEYGAIKVRCNRIILDDEEIDIAKGALL